MPTSADQVVPKVLYIFGCFSKGSEKNKTAHWGLSLMRGFYQSMSGYLTSSKSAS
jgi:hypothetical protein